MSVEYRLATEEDAAAVAHLLELVSTESPFLGEVGIKPPVDKLRTLLGAAPTRLVSVVAVAPEAGIAGYAHAIQGAATTMRHVAVVTVAVAADARQRGVGLGLLSTLRGVSAERGWLRLRASVWANNEASRRLFIRAGFQEEAVVPEQLRDLDGNLVDELIFGLRIRAS